MLIKSLYRIYLPKIDPKHCLCVPLEAAMCIMENKDCLYADCTYFTCTLLYWTGIYCNYFTVVYSTLLKCVVLSFWIVCFLLSFLYCPTYCCVLRLAIAIRGISRSNIVILCSLLFVTYTVITNTTVMVYQAVQWIHFEFTLAIDAWHLLLMGIIQNYIELTYYYFMNYCGTQSGRLF